MWQAKADSVRSLTDLLATVVGQILLTLPKFCLYTYMHHTAIYELDAAVFAYRLEVLGPDWC